MKLCDGKYEFRIDEDGSVICLRHGEPWGDFYWNSPVASLFRHAEELQEKMKKYARKLAEAGIDLEK